MEKGSFLSQVRVQVMSSAEQSVRLLACQGGVSDISRTVILPDHQLLCK